MHRFEVIFDPIFFRKSKISILEISRLLIYKQTTIISYLVGSIYAQARGDFRCLFFQEIKNINRALNQKYT